MTTFENFVEAIGNKDLLEPFKFHLLDKPLSLIDDWDFFHAVWALAWFRKSGGSGHIVQAITASPAGGPSVGMQFLSIDAIHIRNTSWWINAYAKEIPWIAAWLKNVPPGLIMQGGYIAASAKQPQLCEYCHVATKHVARKLFRVIETDLRHYACKSATCQTEAKLKIAREAGCAARAIIETNIVPFR